MGTMTKASRRKYINYLIEDARITMEEGFTSEAEFNDYCEGVRALGARDLFIAYCETKEANSLIGLADRMVERLHWQERRAAH